MKQDMSDWMKEYAAKQDWDMVGATKEIPKKYVKAFKRDSKLNEILE